MKAIKIWNSAMKAIIKAPWLPLRLKAGAFNQLKGTVEGEEGNRLALEMMDNRLFRQLVERGLVDLEQGRYKGISKGKISGQKMPKVNRKSKKEAQKARDKGGD